MKSGLEGRTGETGANRSAFATIDRANVPPVALLSCSTSADDNHLPAQRKEPPTWFRAQYSRGHTEQEASENKGREQGRRRGVREPGAKGRGDAEPACRQQTRTDNSDVLMKKLGGRAPQKRDKKEWRIGGQWLHRWLHRWLLGKEERWTRWPGYKRHPCVCSTSFTSLNGP